MSNPEKIRLNESSQPESPWKKWGPYLSERQWGTVREDYSPDGEAWDYFTHDQARSRAYRWGEDGLAGYSDRHQFLCFGLALWNGQDPILKERLFGLSNGEGNHGEDVKEYYFYLDSTPTHSYMKYLYKYPQRAFPYADLVDTNAERGFEEPEYELLDTGVFDEDRYFDLFVEYAKVAPEDTVIRVQVFNRGPETAPLHLLPTLWFRNDWTWDPGRPKPLLKTADSVHDAVVVKAQHEFLGTYHWYFEGQPDLLYCENETNRKRLYDSENGVPFVKDGIHEHVVQGQKEAVNPDQEGTKVAAWYKLTVDPGESVSLHFRLSSGEEVFSHPLIDEVLQILPTRKEEADQYLDSICPKTVQGDSREVFRQAIAGMLWTKQFYQFDLERWLSERLPDTEVIRNKEWEHLRAGDIISMPDKWEYPWFAAWDSAFHTTTLVLVDPDFAKNQVSLFLEDRYQHPNGQIPAYEWNFNDVNPPVHAWATWNVYREDWSHHPDHKRDVDWLRSCFDRLDNNFQWWMTQRTAAGENVYQGGFLGLDNIGLFDRSKELPTGGKFEQTDGTAWMALYAQNMFQISTELALHFPEYEYMAIKYLDEFIQIAAAMDRIGINEDEMWDEEDGFFYDVLRFPDGSATRIKVRSMVGLLPLCAATVIEDETLKRLPGLKAKYDWLVEKRLDLTKNIACPTQPGFGGRRLLAILDEDKLRRVLSRVLDENEFLSPYGIRSLSKEHETTPYVFTWEGVNYEVKYVPGDSDSPMFGGNSNWRGPVWFPMNLLMLRSFIHQFTYYGDDFKMEFPSGSGQEMNLFEIAQAISQRTNRIFLPDENGKLPVHGRFDTFHQNPYWKDLILFYEYFHGDNGSGVGASHQTGWTGLVATGMEFFGTFTAEHMLKQGFLPY